MIVYSVQIADRHIFEKYGRVFSDLLAGCYQRIIGVHFCCFFIIVSGSDLGNIADFIFIPVCNKTDFRVDL